MQATLEKIEKSEAHVRVEVEREKFEEGLAFAYKQVVKKVNIPGFRKGKVPRAVLEAQMGEEVFYEDAVNHLLPEVFAFAVEELNLSPISAPSYNQLEEIKKDEPVVLGFTVPVKPEVKLGQIEGLEVAVVKNEVEDEQIDQLVAEMQNRYAESYTKDADEAAETGDSVTIDFEGFVDGVPFEGGKAEEFPLTLGSNTFIPGFEDQLVGVMPGGEKDVNVTFPENYHAPELAGKPAVFKIKVHQIIGRKLRELNDEFAQEVSEYDTMEELRAGIRRDLEESNEKTYRQELETALKDKLIEVCEMEVSDKVIDDEVYEMMEQFDHNLRGQNFSLERYLKMVGSTVEKFMAEIRPQAETQVKSQFILAEIAKKQKFELLEEELEAELKKIAEKYSKTVEETKKILGEDLSSLKYDMMNSKAMDFLVKHAIVKELKAKNPEEAEEILKK